MATLRDLEEHEGLITVLVNKYSNLNSGYLSPDDYSDLRQSAYLGAMKALNQWRGKKEKCKISTRLHSKVSQEIQRFLAFKQQRLDWRTWLNQPNTRLVFIPEGIESYNKSYHKDFLKTLMAKEDVEILLSGLSQKEIDVMSNSYKDFKKMYPEYTNKQIDNFKCNTRRKILREKRKNL